MQSHKISVINENAAQKEITCQSGDNLLRTLQKHGVNIHAPCGGNGNCGKCKVSIEDEGIIGACSYTVHHDITLSLPKSEQLKVLTSQHDYSCELDEPAKDQHNSVSIGLAVDIGTTTLAFYFVDLVNNRLIASTSATNPQTRYGADVISRIQFCGGNPDRIREMQQTLLDVFNHQIEHTAEKLEFDTKSITKVTVAGNATMQHLFLGVDPKSIALAPFTPVFTEERYIDASTVGLNISPDGITRVLPSISAYIGGDIVAGLASIDANQARFKNYLFLDIGTNGEMALVTPDQIFTCATAAGPAFEGGNISCGMGAFKGAISEYSDPKNYKTIDNGRPIGVCGSGLIDIMAYLVTQEIVKPDGLLEEDFEVWKSRIEKRNITITQQDIREAQLAKSAIRSGLNMLISDSGLNIEDIDALFLAGGFGNYIRIESAIKLGILPPELDGKIIPIGNSSGTGAYLSLQSQKFENNLQKNLEKAKYIELTTRDDFIVQYAMNMGFEPGLIEA